ncbi:hypothetical protein BYT27DRAFT_7180987 [Phlegmacium glaucopus]|nr:hypothetical protein BYT27DRAFT_7180987 [Phlegmacium glaucopus]
MPYLEYDKWLLGPAPVSKIQKITVKLRSFDIKILGERVLNREYPSNLHHPKYPQTIWFWEIRGRGRPPNDVQAHPGDIYIDMAASPIVNVFQKDVHGWTWWWDPSSTEMSKTFNVLLHPHIHDRALATLKGRGFAGFRQIFLSYLSTSTIRQRGSTAERDLSCQSDLAAGFPTNTIVEVKHGTVAVAGPVGSKIQVSSRRVTEDYGSIVVSTSLKSKTASGSTLPANHSQARSFQDNLEGVSALEKILCEERISSQSTIDELKTKLARERYIQEVLSQKLNKARNELRTSEALHDNLNAKYELALHRLGDARGQLIGVKRKLSELYSELRAEI